jgi:hypothetical protein
MVCGSIKRIIVMYAESGLILLITNYVAAVIGVGKKSVKGRDEFTVYLPTTDPTALSAGRRKVVVRGVNKKSLRSFRNVSQQHLTLCFIVRGGSMYQC